MTEEEMEKKFLEWWGDGRTGPWDDRKAVPRKAFLEGRQVGIKEGREEIEGLKVKINHLAGDIKQMEETIREVNSTPIRKHFDRSYRSQE